jgi:hypothetical protein
MRVAIILIGICGGAICLFWLPMTTAKSFEALSWVALQKVENWIQYAFHWLVSLPCFWLLIMAWKITSNMQKGRLFIEKNAVHVKRATVILLVDILLFLIGNIIFAALGWNEFLILQLFATMVGFIVAILLFVLSQYLMKATSLQEECDLTV